MNFADFFKFLSLWMLFKRNLQVPSGPVHKMFRITYTFIRLFLMYFFYFKFLVGNFNLALDSVFLFTKNDWQSKDEPFITNNSYINAVICQFFWCISTVICWVYFLFLMYIYTIMIIINSCDYVSSHGLC